MPLSQDHIRWLETHLGEDIAEWVVKEASLGGIGDALSPYIDKAQNWYRENPLVGNALGVGLAGAGLGGGLTAISNARPGEDKRERTMRIMRNAAMGGLMGAGGTAAIQAGAQLASAPRGTNPAEVQLEKDREALFGTWPATAGAGFVAGATGGGVKAHLANRSIKAQGKLDMIKERGERVLNSKVVKKELSKLGPNSRIMGGLRGGGYGALLGLAPAALAMGFDAPSNYYGMLTRRYGGHPAMSPEEAAALTAPNND